MIKAILFDVDGVIVNSERFSLQYQKRFNISNDEMLPFFVGEFQECIVGKADLKEIIKTWLSKWNWEGTVDEFLQFWFKSEYNIDDNVMRVVKKLRAQGIICCLATKQEKYRTEYMKKEMGFEDAFDHIYSSFEIGYKKPEKEFYEFILNDLYNKYGVNANETAFLDDEQKNVDGAKSLGIDARLYESFQDLINLKQEIL